MLRDGRWVDVQGLKTFEIGETATTCDNLKAAMTRNEIKAGFANLMPERAYGTHGFEEWLMRFHGEPVRDPINREYVPRGESVAWRRQEMFRGPARE